MNYPDDFINKIICGDSQVIIGIEISPEYCKIAEARLKQQVLNF